MSDIHHIHPYYLERDFVVGVRDFDGTWRELHINKDALSNSQRKGALAFFNQLVRCGGVPMDVTEVRE